jgi:hypothetical protein
MMVHGWYRNQRRMEHRLHGSHCGVVGTVCLNQTIMLSIANFTRWHFEKCVLCSMKIEMSKNVHNIFDSNFLYEYFQRVCL